MVVGAFMMGKSSTAGTRRSDSITARIMAPLASDLERLARFERGAKTLASLNHPHITAIDGFEKSSGMHALATELVEGDGVRADEGTRSLEKDRMRRVEVLYDIDIKAREHAWLRGSVDAA